MKKHLPYILLVSLVAIYIFLFIYFCYQQYIYLELFDVNDTATNMQTVWSIIHGPFFTSTVNEYLRPVPHNILGDQLYFTLAFYLPFWLIFKSPFTFVVVTVVVVGLSAVPLFFMARDRLGCPWTSLVICANYLFNSTGYNTYLLFGFRPETLAMPFVLAAFYFIWKQKHLYALVFIVLTILTKHDGLLIAGGIAVYLLFKPGKDRRLGGIILALAFIYFFAVVQPLFTHFSDSPAAMIKLLGEFGPDPLSAGKNLLLHPGLYFQEVSWPELRLLALTLLPVGFLCLPSPVFYICLPIILYNFLDKEYGSIHCGWHWALVVPFIYIGTVDTLARYRPVIEKYGRRIIIPAIIFAAAAFVFEGSFIADHIKYQAGFYYRRHNVDTKKMIKALDVIEPAASVSCMYRMLWFVCLREKVYYNCTRFNYDTDYVVITYPLDLGQNPVTDKYMITEVEKFNSVLHRDYYPVVSDENITILKRRDQVR